MIGHRKSGQCLAAYTACLEKEESLTAQFWAARDAGLVKDIESRLHIMSSTRKSWLGLYQSTIKAETPNAATFGAPLGTL